MYRLPPLPWTVALFAAAAGAATAYGREPAIPPQLPPGQTLGVPIAVNPPPGWVLINRLSYADYTLRDNQGAYNGQKATVVVDSIQVNWIPGVTVLGGAYKAFVLLPFVDMDITRTTTATGKLGSWHSTGMGNPKIQPLDLNWAIGDHWRASSGIGAYLPLGQYSKGAPLPLAGNFWTLEPSLGITWLNDGWHFSAHGMYDTNTRNPDNHYRSGDQVFLNLTLTKAFAGWNLGPVAYYQKQVTADSNEGGRPTYGGKTFPDPQQTGAGLLASTAWGKLRLYAMATRDFDVRNTLGGDKLWFNVAIPLP